MAKTYQARLAGQLTLTLVASGLLGLSFLNGGRVAPSSDQAVASAAARAPSKPGTSPAELPPVGHIFMIVLENKEYDEIIGNRRAPYLNQLAARYALADRYYAIRHPSLPNHLALIGGDTFGITRTCTDCILDRPNLADQLEAHGKTWKAYMEDLPGPCYLGPRAGDYVLRHNPFLYFRHIRTTPSRCRRVVPLTDFGADLAAGALPDFVWITPNLRHGMHSASVAEGDRWLASLAPKILGSDAWRRNGLLLITWDEGRTRAGCCGFAAGGHVATLVIAPHSRHGYRSSVPASHYSLLRMIQELWGLGHLGRSGDDGVHSMMDFFRVGAAVDQSEVPLGSEPPG